MSENLSYSQFLLRVIDSEDGYAPEDKELLIRNTPYGAQLVYKFNGREYALRQDENILMEDVLYEDLVRYIHASKLIPGKKYRLLDYQTIYNHAGSTKLSDEYFNEIGIGPKEVLILTAASNNKLCIEAISESCPNDIIWYQYNDKESLVWDGNNASDTVCAQRPGFIIYRQDPIRNLSAHYDWRNVQWATPSNAQDLYKDPFCSTFDDGSSNISIAKDASGIILHQCTACEIKNNVHAVTMYRCSNNTIGPNAQHICLHDGSDNNVIHNSSMCVLYDTCLSNNINDAHNCVFGTGSGYNIVNTANNLSLGKDVAYESCNIYNTFGLYNQFGLDLKNIVALTIESTGYEEIDFIRFPEQYLSDLESDVSKKIICAKIKETGYSEPIGMPYFQITTKEEDELEPTLKTIVLI